MRNVQRYLSSHRLNAFSTIAGFIIFSLSLIVLISPQWDYRWMKSAILWFSLSVFGPAFVVLVLNSLSKLQKLGMEILEDSPRITIQPIIAVIVSISILGFALVTTLSVNAFPFETWANVLAFIIACAFFMSYGAISYLYILTIFFAIRVSKSRVKGNLFNWPREKMEEIYSTYFRLLLVGGITYMLAVGVVRLTPWATSWKSLDQPWIHLWVLPPGVVLILYFVIFTIGLHNLFYQCRNREEREIGEKLQEQYNLWKEQGQSSTETTISALIAWRNSIRQEKVWPMDYKGVLATIITLLIPTIEAIAKVIKWSSG